MFVQPITEIYACFSKVIRVNNIPTEDSVHAQQNIKELIESIVKVQDGIVKRTDREFIKSLLADATTNLKEVIGGALTQETETLIGKFSSNFDSIETSFQNLKESIEEQGREVLAALRKENSDLKKLIEEKN
jgi:phage-related protein